MTGAERRRLWSFDEPYEENARPRTRNSSGYVSTEIISIVLVPKQYGSQSTIKFSYNANYKRRSEQDA